MDTRLFRALAVVLVFPWSAAAQPAGDPNDLVLSVSLNQATFDLGTPVVYTVSICNPTAETITVLSGGSCTCEVPRTAVKDMSGATVAFETCDGCGGGFFWREWQPGQCSVAAPKTWRQTLDRFNPYRDEPTGPPASAGAYRLLVNEEFYPAVFIQGASPVFVLGDAIAVPAMGPASAVIFILLLATLGLVRVRRGAA